MKKREFVFHTLFYDRGGTGISGILRLGGLKNALGDDTRRGTVSSKTVVWGLGGPETPRSDDTTRRIVSSKTRISRLMQPRMSRSDDTTRRIVSSKTGISRLGGLETP